jgi:S-formylglutathione hydrolase
MECVSKVKSFGGWQLRYKHRSEVLSCDMHFSLYLPPQAETAKVPVLYWLSGLTCTDENFVTKAGAQQYAALHGVAIVAPDTSPRGDDVPDDPEGAWDFGLAAGFYVNATQAPWSTHYRMYDYVLDELPSVLQDQPLDLQSAAISGHSMGGHGAMTIALNNPERYKSVSAFAPICAPSQVPWGHKAFGNYLGDDKSTWLKHDTVALVEKADTHLPILVDQGLDDGFLEEQLRPELLIAASEQAGYPMTIRQHEGYDHSYFFIASFFAEHMGFHARHLTGND